MRIQKKTDLMRVKGQASENAFTHLNISTLATLYNKEKIRNPKKIYMH